MADDQSNVVVGEATIMVGDVVTSPASNASGSMETPEKQAAEDAADALSLAVAAEALVIAETADINAKTVEAVATDVAEGQVELWQLFQTLQMEFGLMVTRLTTLETVVSTLIPQISSPEPPAESVPETVIVEPETQTSVVEAIAVSSESAEGASPARKTNRNRHWM